MAGTGAGTDSNELPVVAGLDGGGRLSAQVEIEKRNVMYCRAAAPVNGRVGLRLIDPGDRVVIDGILPAGGTPGSGAAQAAPHTGDHRDGGGNSQHHRGGDQQ